MRDDGMTLVAIAEKLTVEKVPTARGRHPLVAVARELGAQPVRSRWTVSLADIRARQATSCSCAAVARSSLACSHSSRNVSSVTVTVSPSSGEATSESPSRCVIPAGVPPARPSTHQIECPRRRTRLSDATAGRALDPPRSGPALNANGPVGFQKSAGACDLQRSTARHDRRSVATPALPDLQPAIELADAAPPRIVVQGRRAPCPAPRGRRTPQNQPQAAPGLGRPSRVRRYGSPKLRARPVTCRSSAAGGEA
jgi:hypothetical protein